MALIRGILLAAAAAASSLLFAAPAGAVTITEFEIEAGSPPGTHQPRYIHVGPDGNLWYAVVGATPGIGRVSTSGQMLGIINDPLNPSDLVTGADGTVYWVGDDGIGRRTPNGTVQTEAFSDASDAYTLALTPGNKLFWTERRSSGSAAICYFEEGWGEAKACGAGGSLVKGRITGLAMLPDATFWAAYYEANEVRRVGVDLAGAVVTSKLPAGSGPSRIALGDGRAWVTMFDADAIDSFLPDGARQRFPLPAGTRPNDIAFGPDGALWFTGYNSGTIGRMTTGGAVTLYPIPSANSFPIGIAVGPDGNLWFTESGTGKIGRLVPDPLSGTGDSIAPVFTAAPKFQPKRFAVSGNKSAPKGTPKGTKLKLALSEPATVIATIARPSPGRKAGKLCVAPGKAKSGAKRCTRFVAKGSLAKQLPAGPGSIPFSGKLKGKPLAPGAYRATVSAKDASGNLSAATFAAFTIVG
ncbi:MAG TPA: hypothetical protein VHR18_06305 [Solirubrobacterales bacterium]|nr:hypothetical protein [Solirubrobacterales bacterium]